MKPNPNIVFFVIGPTGSGKSNLAEKIALATHGEIINADAFQIYQQCLIMTASPQYTTVKTHLY